MVLTDSGLLCLYRGRFNANAELLGPVEGEEPHLPDTFLRMPGFTKGVAFVNGFNLGWCARVQLHCGASSIMAGAQCRFDAVSHGQQKLVSP